MRDEKIIQDEVKRAGSSFYAAMRFLPATQKRALFALYAFCRHVDDIADDDDIASTQRMNQLQKEQKTFHRLFHGKSSVAVTPLQREWQWVIQSFPVSFTDCDAIIQGMMMDCRAPIVAPSLRQLDDYCDHVASAVGRLWLAIFGDVSSHARRYAHHLGRALQLTNIVRDIDDDAQRGRVYLPREWLAGKKIPCDDVASLVRHPALDDVAREVAREARDHFIKANQEARHVKKRAVRHASIMADVYEHMLHRLCARGWKTPRAPISIARWRVAFYVARRHLW